MSTTYIPVVYSGKTLMVDSVNGTDTGGVRGRLDRPYLTLAAAKTAASSGDTILVLPGTYAENGLLADGKDEQYLQNAIVSDSTSAMAIFTDSTYDGDNGAAIPGAAITAHIGGNGKFRRTGAKAAQSPYSPKAVVYLASSSSSLVIDCDELSDSSDLDDSGITASGTVIHETGTLKINSKVISATNNFTVFYQSGSLAIDAETITSTSSTWPAIMIGQVPANPISTAAGTFVIRAKFVDSKTPAFEAVIGSGGACTLIGHFESLVSQSAAVYHDCDNGNVMIVRSALAAVRNKLTSGLHGYLGTVGATATIFSPSTDQILDFRIGIIEAGDYGIYMGYQSSATAMRSYGGFDLMRDLEVATAMLKYATGTHYLDCGKVIGGTLAFGLDYTGDSLFLENGVIDVSANTNGTGTGIEVGGSGLTLKDLNVVCTASTVGIDSTHARGTVTLSGTITTGVVVVIVNGHSTSYTKVGGDTTLTLLATHVTAGLNADATFTSTDNCVAVSRGAVITIIKKTNGTAGNVTLATTGSTACTATRSGATLTGGVTAKAVTVEGTVTFNTAVGSGITWAGSGRVIAAGVCVYDGANNAMFTPQAAPSSPTEGMVYYDSTAHKLKVRVAAAWETVTSA